MMTDEQSSLPLFSKSTWSHSLYPAFDKPTRENCHLPAANLEKAGVAVGVSLRCVLGQGVNSLIMLTPPAQGYGYPTLTAQTPYNNNPRQFSTRCNWYVQKKSLPLSPKSIRDFRQHYLWREHKGRLSAILKKARCILYVFFALETLPSSHFCLYFEWNLDIGMPVALDWRFSVFLEEPRYCNTDFLAYSDTGYSDSPVTVTVLIVSKMAFIYKNDAIRVTLAFSVTFLSSRGCHCSRGGLYHIGTSPQYGVYGITFLCCHKH